MACVHSDTGCTFIAQSAASGRETGLESLHASVHHLPLQLAVKAELLRKVTMEEVKGMQRDLVVQLGSNHGCVRPALQVGVRRRRHLN
jgi:hypothetical protein